MTERRRLFAVEPTPIGPQTRVPGVVPIVPRVRLAARTATPLEPKQPPRPCGNPVLSARPAGRRRGLFDVNARDPLDLFQPKDV